MSGGVWFSTLGLVAWMCCSSLGLVQGGKVLVMPVDGSHWLSMKILVKELSRRGHDVSVLVPETSLLIQGSDSYKTMVYQVPYTSSQLDEKFARLTDGVFSKPPGGITDLFVNVEMLVNFTTMQVSGCESLLNNQPLMTEVREGGFELLLTDPFLPCGSILARMLSIPAVYFLHGLPCQLDLKANQCPSPPSYVPVFFSGNIDKMNFPQRVKNMVMSMVESYMCTVIYRHFDELVSRTFEDLKTYKDLISHGSIWLLRSDFTFEWPKPIMPNMFFIGGINCAKKAPLPTVSMLRICARINKHAYGFTYTKVVLCTETSYNKPLKIRCRKTKLQTNGYVLPGDC